MAALRCVAILIAGLALGAGGCSQTTTQAISEPVVTAPIVLNSAPGAPVAPTALAPAPVVTAAPGTVAATNAVPVAAVPVAVAPAPVAPQPVAAAAPAVVAEGDFPNINKPPVQPEGNLLPEAERARIIAELEAMRAGQTTAGAGGDAGGNGAALADQADTHGEAAIKQIEACSQDGALQTNPDCAPTN